MRRRVVDLNPSELVQPCEGGHFWNPPDNSKVKAYFTNQFFRKRGRPQMRWDDTLRKFGDRQFQQKTWSFPARHTALWCSFENEYIIVHPVLS